LKLLNNLVSLFIKKRVVILSSVHTRYVAIILKERFEHHLVSCNIYFSYSENMKADLYIVICPQIFTILPPANKRVIFQMEQSTSTRWFTKKYLEDLKESKAIIDYSTENLDYFTNLGIPRNALHYLPIGATTNYRDISPQLKKYDFVFYGDYTSSPRRQALLKVLSEKHKVLILEDVFKDELFFAMSKAKAVINFHYYENALLETTRICESLSLGLPILSEATLNMDNYSEFSKAVFYFAIGSTEDLLMSADSLINNLPSSESILEAVKKSNQKFNDHFDQVFSSLQILRNTNQRI